jgi:type II secretory pathway pseudopilin PulG
VSADPVRRARRAGFSTLEIIVAVAVLAAALLPLMIAQRDVIRATARQEAQWARVTAERNAAAFLYELNPMARPTGSVTLGAETIDWTSAALTRPAQTTGFPVGDGEFEAALYRVEVTVTDRSDQVLASFSVERPGWRRIVAPTPRDELVRGAAGGG